MEERDNINQTKVNSMVDNVKQTETEELNQSIALDTDKTKNINSNNTKDGECKLNILEQKLDKIENILTGKFDLAVKKTSERTFASVLKSESDVKEPKQDSTGAASCPNKTAKWLVDWKKDKESRAYNIVIHGKKFWTAEDDKQYVQNFL